MVKNLPETQETHVPSLGWEDPLEKGMATYPVFLPGESHEQRSLVGTVHGVANSQTRLRLTPLLLVSFEWFTFTIYPPYLICLWPWEEECYILSQVTGKWPTWNGSQSPQDYRSYVRLAPADGIMDEKTRMFLQLSNLLLPYQYFALYTQEKIKQ